MSAKNTAVNLMILSTFLSFLLYRARTSARSCVGEDGDADPGRDVRDRRRHRAVLRHSRLFREAIVRIGYSVYQVGAVLACIVFVTIIDVLHGARRAVPARFSGARCRRARSTRSSFLPSRSPGSWA